jgi:hypothetical protein
MKKWIIIGAVAALGTGVWLNHKETTTPVAKVEKVVTDKMGNARGQAYEKVPFSQAYTSELISSTVYPQMPLSVVGVYCANLPIFERVEKNKAYHTRWRVSNGSVYDNPLLKTTDEYRSWIVAGSSKVSRPTQIQQPRIWMSLSKFNEETKAFFYQTDISCNRAAKDSPYGNRLSVITNMEKEPIHLEAFEVPGSLQTMRATPQMLNALKDAYYAYYNQQPNVAGNTATEASGAVSNIANQISGQ